jgi:hypothetical protein
MKYHPTTMLTSLRSPPADDQRKEGAGTGK